MPTGGPPITCRSARSTCWTTRCCANRWRPSTSSRACSGTGAPRRASTSSTPTSTASSAIATSTSSTSPARATADPGLVANAYLEGTYSEVYSGIEEDADGLRKLFRQFSFPGGIPSHVAAETPGSIHEGGELGYALVHAYGAAFDNPDLVVACVIGDGEAETGPLAASWHSNKFLNPVTDGAVLPILHLNGYKIANPTVLARIPQDELESLLYGYGYRPITVAGDDPANVHQQLAAALDEAFDEIARHPAGGAAGRRDRPTAVADDRAAHPEGLDRARRRWTARRWRAPGGRIRCRCPRRTPTPSTCAQLEEWLRSYRARGAVRRAGRAPARAAGAGADRAAPDERQPARQRRAAAARSRPARLPRLRRRRGQTGDRNRRSHPRARRRSFAT